LSKYVPAAERDYMARVARRGCAVCRRLGFDVDDMQAIVHHQAYGRGGWKRSSNYRTIGVCLIHHVDPDQGIHGINNAEAYEAHFGFSEQDLIEETQRALEQHVPANERIYQ
jgi:hypothetical protein